MYADALCAVATPANGELDDRRYRLNDISARLQAVLDNATQHIDRRYGSGPIKGSGAAETCQPARGGSVGMLDDTIDRLEALADRVGAVVGTLGAL